MPRRARPASTSRRPRRRAASPRWIAESPAMQRLAEHVLQVAATRSPLLIEGEPGSGRHRIAAAIHAAGPRAAAPFLRVLCGALPPEHAADAIFGADGGAGAGLWAGADGGTLFLDEVSALPAVAQARLLLALHERGHAASGPAARRSDVRVIASTSLDLGEEVALGRFRADLRDRLGVVRLRVPALRERREDFAPLVAELLAQAARTRPRGARGITPGALERLAAQAWPGNVGELRDVLGAMVSARRGRGPLTVSDLPPAFRVEETLPRIEAVVGMTVGEVERRLIAATLAHSGADKRRAAALLGIGLRTLYRKIREYGLG